MPMRLEEILEPPQMEELNQIKTKIWEGASLTTIENDWKVFLEGSGNVLLPSKLDDTFENLNSATQFVLDEAYKRTNKNLQIHMDKLKQHRSLLSQISKDIEDNKQIPQEQITLLQTRLSEAEQKAQLTQTELENALQKQQQTIQMMSDISKALHDAAMAVIRNIG